MTFITLSTSCLDGLDFPAVSFPAPLLIVNERLLSPDFQQNKCSNSRSRLSLRMLRRGQLFAN